MAERKEGEGTNFGLGVCDILLHRVATLARIKCTSYLWI